MHEVQIGLVLPMWSASSVVGGFTVGPGIDRYGLLFGLVFGACCAVIAFVCTWYGNEKLVSCDSFVARARAHVHAYVCTGPIERAGPKTAPLQLSLFMPYIVCWTSIPMTSQPGCTLLSGCARTGHAVR